MNERIQRSEQILILCGITLLLLSLSRTVRSVLSPYRAVIEQSRIEGSMFLSTFSTAGVETIRGTADLPAKIIQLERENRTLSARLLESEIHRKLVSASASTQIMSQKKDPTTSAVLSYLRGEWIILIEKDQGVLVGDSVLLDGVYLGTVKSVSLHASTIALLSDQQDQLVAQHAKTGMRGVFTRKGDTYSMQFLEKVDSLAVGDLIATIPDGIHTVGTYPMALVKEITVDPAGTGTLVELTVLAKPRIGSRADITLLR